MPGQLEHSVTDGGAFRRLWLLVAIIMYIWFSNAIADDTFSESINQVDVDDSPAESINQDEKDVDKYEIGIEVGVLVFLGADFRIYYHQVDSPWLVGIRYLDIEDDFMNEAAVGIPGDGSDREYTERKGVFVDYLFNPQRDSGSYYLSGAFLQVTSTIECYSESDSDTAAGFYFGGGYRGSFGDRLGYNIGLLISPFVNYDVDAFYCSSTTDGDMDLTASLTFKF